jgi:glycosyltransferase involved in cell wall biosynthesis
MESEIQTFQYRKTFLILKTIVHIAETNISPNAGMGRVEYYWREAFVRQGWNFIQIGLNEVGNIAHPRHFPAMAYAYFKKLNIEPQLLIVHEPCAGYFIRKGVDCIVESHGIEQRYWEIECNNADKSQRPSLKTRILFPLWRLRNCNYGLRKASKLLLINTDDAAFVKQRFQRKDKDFLIFKNGYSNSAISLETPKVPYHKKGFTVLFNGSWIARKGIQTLLKSASIMQHKGLDIHYLIIGTGKEAGEIVPQFDTAVQKNVTVIAKFDSTEEQYYLSHADVFVLPSNYEGQPLSLIEAMRMERCCITTNICGQKDLITNEINGYLFEPNDSHTVAKIIEQLFTNPSKIKEIGMNARQFLGNRDWVTVSDEVVNWVVK